MDIKLDEEQLRTVVSGAIFKTLDEQQKDLLIQGAIQHLLTVPPSTNSYDRRKSPLMEAFNYAVNNVAKTVAVEMVTKDEKVKSTITDLVHKAMDNLLDPERNSKVVDSITDAIVKGMTGDRY